MQDFIIKNKKKKNEKKKALKWNMDLQKSQKTQMNMDYQNKSEPTSRGSSCLRSHGNSSHGEEVECICRWQHLCYASAEM